MIIGCLGMTTLDTLLFTESIPNVTEGLGRVSESILSLGGKGMVTSLAIHCLGCNVAIFTLVGDKLEVLKLLPHSFSIDYFQECLYYNNKTWIAMSKKQEVVTYVCPSNIREKQTRTLLQNVSEFVEKVGLLYISTEYIPVIRRAVEVASHLRTPVVTNPNLPLLTDPDDKTGDVFRLLINKSHTVLLNEVESEAALFKLGKKTWADVLSDNLQEVIITKGEKGGVFSQKPFTTWQSYDAEQPSSIECVVGAGDTFNGAYIKYRFVDGLSQKESCTYAARVASKKISTKSSHLIALE